MPTKDSKVTGIGVQTSQCIILTSETYKCSNKIKFKTILWNKLQFYFFTKKKKGLLYDQYNNKAVFLERSKWQIIFLYSKKPLVFSTGSNSKYVQYLLCLLNQHYTHQWAKFKIPCSGDCKAQLLSIYSLLVKEQ